MGWGGDTSGGGVVTPVGVGWGHQLGGGGDASRGGVVTPVGVGW